MCTFACLPAAVLYHEALMKLDSLLGAGACALSHSCLMLTLPACAVAAACELIMLDLLQWSVHGYQPR